MNARGHERGTSNLTARRGSTGPTLERERIDSLDVLRGVALLGILVINIQAFAMPTDAFPMPNVFGSMEGWNRAVWIVSHVVFEQKFMTMFSIMFGAGIVLMSEHRDAAGQPVLGVHYRRMILMLGFGFFHAYVIWFGDVLVSYATCGLIVVWCRKWKPQTLLATGVILIVLGSVFLFNRSLHFITTYSAMDFHRPAFIPWQYLQEEVEAYRGSWSDHFPYRFRDAKSIQVYSIPRVTLWRLSGLMCVGMALYKWGVLSAARSRRFYLLMALNGAILGLPVFIYSAHASLERSFSPVWEYGPGSLLVYWGSLPSSVMWIGLVMLLCTMNGLRFVRHVLGAYGRMAFSNYIGQSLMGTWLFYGYGLGWFGSVSRVEQAGVVLGIWAVGLTLSPIWLRFFKFGPLEWLWRSGVYWKFQPMLRRRERGPVAVMISGPIPEIFGDADEPELVGGGGLGRPTPTFDDLLDDEQRDECADDDPREPLEPTFPGSFHDLGDGVKEVDEGDGGREVRADDDTEAYPRTHAEQETEQRTIDDTGAPEGEEDEEP